MKLKNFKLRNGIRTLQFSKSKAVPKSNAKLANSKFFKLPILLTDNLVNWQFGQPDYLVNWHFGQLTIWSMWQFGQPDYHQLRIRSPDNLFIQLTFWATDNLANWQIGQLTTWSIVNLVNWEFGQLEILLAD